MIPIPNYIVVNGPSGTASNVEPVCIDSAGTYKAVQVLCYINGSPISSPTWFVPTTTSVVTSTTAMATTASPGTDTSSSITTTTTDATSSTYSTTASTTDSTTDSTTASTTDSTTASTTDSTTTPTTDSTTTSTAPSPTVIDPNYGFDHDSQDISPWQIYDTGNGNSWVLDGDIKHDGAYSVAMTFGATESNYVMRPIDTTRLKAGDNIYITAWFHTVTSSSGACNNAIIKCTTNGISRIVGMQTFPGYFSLSTWYKGSLQCSVNQETMDAGGFNLIVGWDCSSGATGWVDTVDIQYPVLSQPPTK